jgi:hypothetical protein
MPRLTKLNVTEPQVDRQVCSGCGKTKPADAFFRDRWMKSGLRSRCKDCVSKDAKKRYVRNGGRPRTTEQRRAERARAAAQAGVPYAPREHRD